MPSRRGEDLNLGLWNAVEWIGDATLKQASVIFLRLHTAFSLDVRNIGAASTVLLASQLWVLFLSGHFQIATAKSNKAEIPTILETLPL